MALPYVLDLVVTAVEPWPAVAEVAAASSYAIVRFAKAAGETADDAIQSPVVGVEGEIVIRIHQAQKDDISVGDLLSATIDTT